MDLHTFSFHSTFHEHDWIQNSSLAVTWVCLTCSGHSVTFMSPSMPSGWNRDSGTPVVNDSRAFLSWKETRISSVQRLWCLIWWPFLGDSDLENALAVDFLQAEGKPLSEDAVEPTLQDGRDAEPVERKLETAGEIHFTAHCNDASTGNGSTVTL